MTQSCPSLLALLVAGPPPPAPQAACIAYCWCLRALELNLQEVRHELRALDVCMKLDFEIHSTRFSAGFKLINPLSLGNKITTRCNLTMYA